MCTLFWLVISGLLLAAVAKRNVTTDVSHTHTHTLTQTQTHTHTHHTPHTHYTHTHTNTPHTHTTHTHTHTHQHPERVTFCLSHENRRLNSECCSTVHCSEWTQPWRLQTATQLQRVSFEQELRHPHIDKYVSCRHGSSKLVLLPPFAST